MHRIVIALLLSSVAVSISALTTSEANPTNEAQAVFPSTNSVPVSP
jgi:hypothetical protein